MASLPLRDPVGDHLLTPQNATFLVIAKVIEIVRTERLLKA
jgi:hypothetical protein